MDKYDKLKWVVLGCLLIAMTFSHFSKDLDVLLAAGFYLVICEQLNLRRDMNDRS